MRVREIKKGQTKIVVDAFDDLWYLNKIISPGDIVVGETERKYRTEYGKEERKGVKLELAVESIELHKYANVLRVRGKILSGVPEEFIKIGAYHTIDIVPHRSFILKKELSQYENKMLKEAQQAARRPLLQIIVLDERRANFATLRSSGLDWGPEILSRTSKADPEYEQKMKKYFAEISKVIPEERKILIAGPGFVAEAFSKYLKERSPALAQRIALGHTSSAERSGVYELIKGGAVLKIIKEDKLSLEFEKIEAFLSEIRKDGLAVYGREVIDYAQAGALKELFVLDELLRKEPEIFDIARKGGCEVTIFTSEDEPWRKLKRFGGLAGILRYKVR